MTWSTADSSQNFAVGAQLLCIHISTIKPQFHHIDAVNHSTPVTGSFPDITTDVCKMSVIQHLPFEMLSFIGNGPNWSMGHVLSHRQSHSHIWPVFILHSLVCTTYMYMSRWVFLKMYFSDILWLCWKWISSWKNDFYPLWMADWGLYRGTACVNQVCSDYQSFLESNQKSFSLYYVRKQQSSSLRFSLFHAVVKRLALQDGPMSGSSYRAWSCLCAVTCSPTSPLLVKMSCRASQLFLHVW